MAALVTVMVALDEASADAKARVKSEIAAGKARAAKLTPEERSEIARKAARARWEKSDWYI